MINHDMNEVAEYATKVAVMNDGRLVRYTSPGELFKEEEFLESIGLELPFAVREAGLLRKKVFRWGTVSRSTSFTRK